MPDISRRNFLRNATVGAAAAGAVAVAGTSGLGLLSSASAAPGLASPATPTMEGSDVFAHVVDAKAGRLTIFVGNKSIEYTNVDLAQRLLKAAQ